MHIVVRVQMHYINYFNFIVMVEPIYVALTQFGICEFSDLDKSAPENAEVLKYFHQTGYDWVKDDEMAWCSAFVNWCCLQSNKPMSGKLNARSWLNVGTKTEKPSLGDVVVLWREDRQSWKGHVGFYIRQTDRFIYILGGNQGGEVSIKRYPKYRLLEYRKL